MNKIIKLCMALMISLSLVHINVNQVEASSYADKLVDIAMSEKGNGYKTKYGSAYGGTSTAWCASFVTWAARNAGIPTSIIPSTASAYGMYTGVKNGGGKIVSSPQKGDLVFYKRYSNDSSICHVGIMISSSMSIQGNYSDQVKYMSPYDYRLGKGKPPISKSKIIFVRPNYSKTGGSNSTTNNSTNNSTPAPVVTKKNISNCTVKGLESKYEYTSSAIKPSISVYNGSSKLSSSNYTVSYSKNTNPGTATITIKGKNNYTGTITKTFTILPVDFSKLNATKATVPTDLSIYTEETIKTLNNALNTANNLTSKNSQKSVNNADTALKNAIKGLVIKKADYSAIDELLTTIPEDLSDYTEKSVLALNNAVEAIVRDKLITEQAEVDLMKTNLQSAIDNLQINYFRSEVVIPVLGCALLIGAGIFIYKKKKTAVYKPEESVEESTNETTEETVEENKEEA